MNANIFEDIWIIGGFLKWIYRFIRRHMNYEQVLKNAVPLKENVSEEILKNVKQNKFFPKTTYLCLVHRGYDKESVCWEVLFISEKFKFLNDLELSDKENSSLFQLDKRKVYKVETTPLLYKTVQSNI